jgi:hypothetical protein
MTSIRLRCRTQGQKQAELTAEVQDDARGLAHVSQGRMTAGWNYLELRDQMILLHGIGMPHTGIP